MDSDSSEEEINHKRKKTDDSVSKQNSDTKVKPKKKPKKFL